MVVVDDDAMMILIIYTAAASYSRSFDTMTMIAESNQIHHKQRLQSSTDGLVIAMTTASSYSSCYSVVVSKLSKYFFVVAEWKFLTMMLPHCNVLVAISRHR